ncbi:hypothetical protein EYF80_011251 [Liparis tanakae]|uniref:Uncharacterized protein n=1 Tax=Liparis tanakae TaxID=230148 RepID=A0A4Z2IL75_9TELE|nr:hypothetical protein EYF80_011251 [Liparis tanakae]
MASIHKSHYVKKKEGIQRNIVPHLQLNCVCKLLHFRKQKGRRCDLVLNRCCRRRKNINVFSWIDPDAAVEVATATDTSSSTNIATCIAMTTSSVTRTAIPSIVVAVKTPPASRHSGRGEPPPQR